MYAFINKTNNFKLFTRSTEKQKVIQRSFGEETGVKLLRYKSPMINVSKN